jgi:hypothetical protein
MTSVAVLSRCICHTIDPAGADLGGGLVDGRLDVMVMDTPLAAGMKIDNVRRFAVADCSPGPAWAHSRRSRTARRQLATDRHRHAAAVYPTPPA